jgi:hypothetical protein
MQPPLARVSLRTVIRVRVGVVGASLLLAGAGPLLGHAAPPLGSDALRAAADADEVQLSRIAARVGDDCVLAALPATADPLAQLAAIRAAPYLTDKEQALLPLATIAASRDPELAPLAAWKVLRVTQALVHEGLVLREVVPSSLAPARAALIALAADDTARSDIRSCAGQAAHLLGTLGVPSSTSGSPKHEGNEPSASN